jgi:transcriptional repressor NF-X1
VDDLTSKLIHDLRTSPYLDCVVCYNPIRPLQPTWSCSPNSPITLLEGTQEAQYCWVTSHLKCVRSWASKSITDTRNAYEARGENKPGEWSCIGCRAKRTIEPSTYRYAVTRSSLFCAQPRIFTQVFLWGGC